MSIFILPRSWICARFKVGVVYCASYCKCHSFPMLYFRFYRKIRSSEQIFHLKWLFKNSVLSHWQTQLSCFWLFESCIFDVTTSTFSRRRNTSRATWLICRLRLSSFRISVHIFLLFMNHIILPAFKFLSLKAHFCSSAGYNNLGFTSTGQETDWQPLVTRENWVFPFQLVSGC